MQQRGQGGPVFVQSQSRVYAAVIGVTIGMLVAGLGVPLAFGQTPSDTPSASSAPTDLDFGTDPGTGLPPAGAPGEPVGTPGSVPGSPNLPNAPGSPGSPGSLPSANPGNPGGNPSNPGSNPSNSPAPTGPLTASDQGVTASTIKVGVVLLDVEALKLLGFGQPHFSPREQQKQFQLSFDQVNKSGGILGRKLVPNFVTWNALDTNGSKSGGAVCSRLAEDDKVFAVVGFLGDNIAECMTQRFGIPAIADVGHIAEAYTKGRNLLVSPFASLERGAANWGYFAARTGLVKGRKVGTVYLNVPEESRPESALVGALSKAGVKATVRGNLGADQQSAQSKTPVVVQQMKSAGVNTVFLSTNFIVAKQFVQTAQQQGFKPTYITSDLGSLITEGLVSGMPTSFDGSYGFTQGAPGSPEPALNTKCRNAYNASAGTSYGAGTDAGAVYLVCWQLKVFELAAKRAGANLTRTGMGNAFQQLGSVPLFHNLGGSFKAGKTDYGDYFRPVRYARSCKCYSSLGGAQRGAY